MKKTAVFTLVAVMAAMSTYSDAVSLNWKQFAGAINDVIDPYGVETASNWQNLQQIASGTDIILSSGASSTVDFSSTQPGGWATFYGGGPLDNTPMRAGMVTYSSTGGPTVTLSDLNGTFATYDVIVYIGGFNAAAGGNQGAVSDGTTTKYIQIPNPFTGALVESTDTDIGDGADVGSYVRFDGLTADSVTISLLSPNNTGVAIGGLQVVGDVIPEPATLGLFALSGAAALFIRRKCG